MLVFRHELRDFLKANLDRAFMTCTAHGCVVFQFIKTKDPRFIGSVTSKRIRQYTAEGVVTTDTLPWLLAFIVQCDLHGVRNITNPKGSPAPITGQEALELLEAGY